MLRMGVAARLIYFTKKKSAVEDTTIIGPNDQNLYPFLGFNLSNFIKIQNEE